MNRSLDPETIKKMEDEMYQLTSEYATKVVKTFEKYGCQRLIAGVSVVDLPNNMKRGELISIAYKIYLNPFIFSKILKKSIYGLFRAFSNAWADYAEPYKDDAQTLSLFADGSDKVQ